MTKFPIQILLKFVPRSKIDDQPVMVEVMGTGGKSLLEPTLTQFTDAFMRH